MSQSPTITSRLVLLSLVFLFCTPQAFSKGVPCRPETPMWCLDWQPVVQVWDPDGNKDYEKLPTDMVTVSLVDRQSNQLLVGPVQLVDGDDRLVFTMALDERIELSEGTNGVHLHSKSADGFDLRLVLHASPRFTDPELSLPGQKHIPLDAEFHIAGILTIGDEEHVWMFPAYYELPIIFKRLRTAGADTAKGFEAYLDKMKALGGRIFVGDAFRKKILAMDLLIKLETKDKSSSRKGAFLYRFDRNDATPDSSIKLSRTGNYW